jgi:hypothetical protein
MNKQSKVLIGLGVILFLAYVVYSSLGTQNHRLEVCVEFQGQSGCAIATGSTRQEAQRTATDTACAKVTSGMTNTMACSQRPPISVTER